MQIPEVKSTWFQAASGSRVLLAAFAHPDDESFGPGGTLARYAAEGVDVHYLCATRGEAGTVDPELIKGYAEVGDLRWAELEAASRVLGLTGLHYLGYRDSGMAGSEDNGHPSALVQADRHVLVGQVVAAIRALRPQVAITSDPFGGYGHPDHIAIHQATVEAFAAAADPSRYPEQIAAGLTPFAPQKLYYAVIPKGFLKVMVRVLRLLGRDPTRFGRNQDINLAEIATWEQPVTARLDVRRYLGVKQQAGEHHRSQGGQGGPFRWIPGPVRSRLLGFETFTRAEPPVRPGESVEADLFAGM